MDPIEEFIFKRILMELAKKNFEANEFIFKKVVGGAGGYIVKFFRIIDSDGDGVSDSEEELYTLDTPVLILDNGFALVNKDDEVGLGYPSLRFVSSSDVVPALQDSDYISAGENTYVDLDGDGAFDEVIQPVPYDGDGDGLPDFEIVVDDDDNGLPDLSPYSPFYPIGSEGYQEIVETYSQNVPALDKSFHNYTVSEALLFLIAFCAGIGVISKIIRRRKL